MEGVGWIMAIILGALAGWIAEKVMKANMGLVMNIVLGIVGRCVLVCRCLGDPFRFLGFRGISFGWFGVVRFGSA